MTVEQTNKEKENDKITFNKRFFFRIPMQGRHLVRDFFVVSGKKQLSTETPWTLLSIILRTLIFNNELHLKLNNPIKV